LRTVGCRQVRRGAGARPDRSSAVDRLTDPAGQALPGVHRSRWRTRPPAGRSAPQPARIPSRNCRHANLCRRRGVVGRAAGVGREMPPGAVENRDRRWQDRGGLREASRSGLARCSPLCRRVRRTGREGRVDVWIAGGERRKCAHKDKLVPGPEAPRCRRKPSRGDRFRSSLVNRPARHSYRLPKNSPKDRATTNTKSAASAMLELVAELHSAEGEAELVV
jgi:hypothetical protein